MLKHNDTKPLTYILHFYVLKYFFKTYLKFFLCLPPPPALEEPLIISPNNRQPNRFSPVIFSSYPFCERVRQQLLFRIKRKALSRIISACTVKQ